MFHDEDTVEAPDPRVDLMREFTDLDRNITHREDAVARNQKELAELRAKRDHLRKKIQQAIAPEHAESDEAVDTLRRKLTGDSSVTFNDGGVIR